MKRAEKKVLTAIMAKPRSLADLFRSLRLPTIKIRQAVHSLIQAGDIQFDGHKFHINRTRKEGT